MTIAGLFDILIPVLLGGAIAAGLLAFAQWWFGDHRQTARQLIHEVSDRTAFLFDGEDLVDATPPALELLKRSNGPGSDWGRILALLEPGFPTLSASLRDLPEKREVSITAAEGYDHASLKAEAWGDFVRLVLQDDHDQSHGAADHVTIAAMEDEIATLRALSEDSPQLIWKLDQSGQVVWANRAYLHLAAQLSGSGPDGVQSWPPPQVFEQITGAPPHGEPTRRRVSCRPAAKSEESWFEVTSLRRGNGSVHFAQIANGLVRAERAQREFVQTLTKTFADLQIGLVIFDRHRRLVLFNPAFLEMSGLPVEFLSARPMIQSVLDRLRDARILPEPKDYSSWRDQMAALEGAAKSGTYCENWALPGGEIFRVTGRPHPDGAIAFLFEDISSEVTLTRRFRSELEFGQSVIDNIDEAVAVFASSGAQIAINRPYRDLWSVAFDERGLDDVTFAEELTRWRGLTVPTPAWGDLKEFSEMGAERAEWTDAVQMVDGRSIACRFVPLPGGATMVAFRPIEAQALPEALDPVDAPAPAMAGGQR